MVLSVNIVKAHVQLSEFSTTLNWAFTRGWGKCSAFGHIFKN